MFSVQPGNSYGSKLLSRTISPALQAHLNGSLLTVTTLVKLTRTDNVVISLSTFDRPLTFAGVTYLPMEAVDNTAIRVSISGIDNLDVTGVLQSPAIRDIDLLAGIYDNAACEIFLLNWAQSPLTDRVLLVSGYLGSVTYMDGGYHAEIRALSSRLTQQIGEQTSPVCRVFQLGDTRCKVKLGAVPITGITQASPAVVTTSVAHGRVVGDTVYFSSVTGMVGINSQVLVVRAVPSSTTFSLSNTAGSAYDTTGFGAYTGPSGQIGYRFSMSVLSVTSPLVLTIGADANPSSFFAYGMITFTSGANLSISREIKSHSLVSGNAALTLAEAFPFAVSPGDAVILEAGCDRTIGICSSRFNNTLNNRSEPTIPGNEIWTRRGRR